MRPGAMTRASVCVWGVTCRTRRDVTPSPASSLPTPSASPSTLVLSPNRSIGAHCHPWGVPAPAERSAAVQHPGTQPAPSPSLPGTRSPTVPSNPPAPPPQSCSAAPGQGAAGAGSDAARSSGRAGGAGAGASPRRPLPRASAHPVAPTSPTPTKPKKRTKKHPDETLQLSEQQAETLLATYPDVGELSRSFFGGISRRNRAKAPDFPC